MSEISLDESVDISRVGLLYDKLNSLMKGDASITLDLSNISHIDCAGLQLIYAFTQDAKNQGIEIIFDHPSDALITAANTIGLVGYFSK
jgi:anti-anti-sigma factor